MISLANHESPQVKLVHEFDRGFLERDIRILEEPLHDDFCHIVYPKSLGVPAVNKEQWLKNMKNVLDSPIRFDAGTYHSLVESPGKLVLHSTHKMEGLTEADAAGRESIWIVEFIADKDGILKIKQVEQFTDSSTYSNLFQAVAVSNE